jgi:hypothetical protein
MFLTKIILIEDHPKFSSTLTLLGRPNIKRFSYNPRSANLMQLLASKVANEGKGIVSFD